MRELCKPFRRDQAGQLKSRLKRRIHFVRWNLVLPMRCIHGSDDNPEGCRDYPPRHCPLIPDQELTTVSLTWRQRVLRRGPLQPSSLSRPGDGRIDGAGRPVRTAGKTLGGGRCCRDSSGAEPVWHSTYCHFQIVSYPICSYACGPSKAEGIVMRVSIEGAVRQCPKCTYAASAVCRPPAFPSHRHRPPPTV